MTMTTGFSHPRNDPEPAPNAAESLSEHWEHCAFKRIASFRSGAGFPIHHQGDHKADLPFFKVSDMNLAGNETVMAKHNNSVSQALAQELGATIFPPRTIIFPKVGGALLTNKRRVTTQHCCIDNNLMGCTVHRGNHEFVRLLLESIDLGEITKPGPVPAISESQVENIRVHFPPVEEQAAIVRYLDHANDLINRYISTKERLIPMLEEQRQAAIQQFITRGLDLTVHLKPSGGEWFGEMPEHWEIRRLAELHLDVTSGTWGEEPTGSGDIACVRVADFDRHHLRAKTDNPTMRHVNNQEVARKRLAKGDLLLEKSGGGDLQPVGIVVLFDNDIPAVCTNFVARLRPAQICTSKYALAIHSTLYAMRVNTRSIKQTTGIQNLDLNTYFSEIVPLPPLPDQYAIVARIDQETARIDASIERAQHQIDLTKEYRTRLIADVVTGQIDVRNATIEVPGQHL